MANFFLIVLAIIQAVTLIGVILTFPALYRREARKQESKA